MNPVIVLFLCVTFFCTVQCLTEEDKKAYHNECVAQTSVEEELIAKAMEGVFTDDAKFKSYLLCFGKKMGIHNDAGQIQKDVMRAKLLDMFSDEATVDKMMECAVDKGTPEETAFEGCKCMYAIKHEFVD